MAVVAAVGSFTVDAGDTASKTVSALPWNDAGSHTPQLILLFAHQIEGQGSIGLSRGVSDGTAHFVVAYSTQDDATSASGRRYANSDRCLHIMNSGGTTLGAFGAPTFNADEFVLPTLTQPSSTFQVRYLALAGLDNVAVQPFEFAAGTGAQTLASVGFQADAVLYLSAGSATLGTAASTGTESLGWSLLDTTQFAIGQRHAVTTADYTASSAASDRVLFAVNTAGTPVLLDCALTSHDATAITLNNVLNMGGGEGCAIHLQGGVWKAGTITAQASTGEFDVATPGCNPVLVMLVASNITTASRTTPFEGASVCVGAAAGSNQWAVQALSDNRETLGGATVTEEYTTGPTDKLWIHHTRASANTLAAAGEIELAAFDTEKFTLDQTDGDPTAVLIGWLAVGEAPAGGGVPIAAISQHHANQGMR